MHKKYYLFLLSGIILLIVSAQLKDNLYDNTQLSSWFHDISQELESERTNIEKQLSQYDFSTCLHQPLPKRINCISGINLKPYQAIVAFQNKKRIYWTDPSIPQPDVVERIKQVSTFWRDGNPYLLNAVQDSLISVYLVTSVDDFMKNSLNINPIDYEFSQTPAQLSYTNSQNEIEFFTNIKTFPKTRWKEIISIICYFIGLIVTLISIFFILKYSFSKQSVFYRSLIISLGLILTKVLISYLDIYSGGLDSYFFSPIFSSQIIGISIAELIINILLTYCIVVLLTNNIKSVPFKPRTAFGEYIYLSLIYFILIICIFFIIFIFREITFSTPLGIDLESTEIWKPASFASLTGIIILIASYFQLSDFLIKVTQIQNYSLSKKMLSLSLSCMLSFGVFNLIPLYIHPFPVYLVSILFILLMDLYKEVKRPGMSWLFIWVGILAACSTALLYKYYQDKLSSEQVEILLNKAFEDTPRINNKNQIHLIEYHNRIDVATYKDGVRTNYTGSYYPLELTIDTVPPIHKVVKISQGDRIEYIVSPQEGILMIAGRSADNLTKALGWYAYLFVLWLAFAMLLAILNSKWNWLPEQWGLKVFQLPSFRRRIQFNILGITLSSFIILGLVTYYYLKSNAKDQSLDEITSKLSILRDDVNQILMNEPELRSTMFSRIVERRADLHRLRPLVFDEEGDRLDQSNSQLSQWTRIPYATFITLKEKSGNDLVITRNNNLVAFAQIPLSKDEIGIIGLSREGANLSPRFSVGIMLNTLLKIYLFLGVIATVIALLVANSITEPIRKIGQRLTEFRLGGKNEPIDWKNPDELGELINNYNLMINELEQSAEILAETERDTAWKEMAKQVAHEIKNPLTPMKLSIQHLEIAMDEEGPETYQELAKRVSKTLIEQIDNLTQIASEFSNFAKMPQPKNHSTSLNDVVTTVHDLFRERDDMDIRLKLPINEMMVFADRNHLVRIMTNLLKNAIQAIPTERKGIIKIELSKQGDNAVVKVQDNGIGIPEEIRDKVFKPNFTSKNSGTGLGLAICTQLAEGFNGRIFFETVVHSGTSFFLEIPLMRTSENFANDNRVILT